MADERCAQALKRLKDRAADVARRALANLSEHSSPAGSYLTQQMAAAMPKPGSSGILPGVNLARQTAAAMHKYDVSGLANLTRATDSSSDDETESNVDEETEED